MHFSHAQKVLFRHCDPAGIVFYPRYFEMINDAVEALFEDLLDWPFHQLHKTGGVPTVHFDVTFEAPTRHGDCLNLDLTLVKLGGSSLNIQTRAHQDQETRFLADQTLVCVDATGKPTSWPDALRQRVADITEIDA